MRITKVSAEAFVDPAEVLLGSPWNAACTDPLFEASNGQEFPCEVDLDLKPVIHIEPLVGVSLPRLGCRTVVADKLLIISCVDLCK